MKKYILKFKGLFILTNTLVIINAAISVALAFMFKYIFDIVETASVETFFKGMVIFGGYIAIGFVFELCLKISKAVYIKKTLSYLKGDVFSHILNKDMRSFNEENSAKYISVLTNDVNMIEQDCLLSIFNLVKYASGFIFAFISVIYISIPITIAIFIVTILALLIPKLFGKRLSEKKSKYSESLEELTGKTKDILSGFEVIRNFNIFSRAKEMYNKSNVNSETKKEKFAIFSGIVDSIAELLGTLMFVAPIVFGGYFVIKGEITIGTLIALIQLMNNLSSPLVQSIKIVNKIKSMKNISQKINSITKETVKDESKYKLDVFNNNIEFKNVSFSYDDNKLALENINIKFEKGKKYALVGASGSGKSTVLKLLLRYYNNFHGNITIDGMSHEEIMLDDIYKQLSVIQQNVFIFDGTIKDNVALYQDYSDEEIIKAMNLSGLSKLLENLPNGIYESVGENGCKLSGGEKQRIAIARALMKNSSIMLLDESTSALDNETAYSIEKSLLRLKDVTSIVVTHKLMEDILKDYDEIIAMKDGKVVESGDFYSLINKKGYFYSLYYVEEGLENKIEMAS
ncbi:ABC transporter ATP-binding protein [Oceanirhabdus sp. W0125-5]|uniref:ABC transporter ATP-binding protein n=1 Tax=Oceanirhabdus sp. W0125-5 TaxID=2999116 RepID=UPI0022F2DA50|nr:ABC transporter ATP-binding protein [Oceanirhabdus sp. W0125-5]WBW96682.1 ABC transporter ATP-binding protein [Oceanirhabdus sp. W0125-5]